MKQKDHLLMRRFVLSLIAIGMAASGLLAADWPQALGPDRNGVIVGEQITPPIGEQRPKVLWQKNVGHGVSPAVIVGGRVYVHGVFRPGTTSEGLADPAATPTSAEIKQIASGKDAKTKSRDVPGTPEWAKQDEHGIFRGDGYVQCLDAETGRTIWETNLAD